MAVAIRRLGLADGAMVEELLDHLSIGWTDGLAPSANGATAFLTDSNSFVFGAYVDHDPAGWLWGAHVRRPSGHTMTYVHELDVVEDHRRRGVATLLMNAAFDEARQRGSYRLWLMTREHNQVARSFYGAIDGEDGDETFRRLYWELG